MPFQQNWQSVGRDAKRRQLQTIMRAIYLDRDRPVPDEEDAFISPSYSIDAGSTDVPNRCIINLGVMRGPRQVDVHYVVNLNDTVNVWDKGNGRPFYPPSIIRQQLADVKNYIISEYRRKREADRQATLAARERDRQSIEDLEEELEMSMRLLQIERTKYEVDREREEIRQNWAYSPRRDTTPRRYHSSEGSQSSRYTSPRRDASPSPTNSSGRYRSSEGSQSSCYSPRRDATPSPTNSLQRYRSSEGSQSSCYSPRRDATSSPTNSLQRYRSSEGSQISRYTSSPDLMPYRRSNY